MHSYIDHSLYFPLDVIPLHFSICPQPSGIGTLKHSEQIIPFIRRNLESTRAVIVTGRVKQPYTSSTLVLL
jgi:hypothetical protein